VQQDFDSVGLVQFAGDTNLKAAVDQAAVAICIGELPAGKHDYRAVWRQLNLQLFNNAEEETAVRLAGSSACGTGDVA